MDSFTVPIGLPPKIKKSGAPDVNGLVIQELQYSFMARHYNLFAEEERLVWPDDCEQHPIIEDLNYLIETRIKKFRDENVEQKQKEHDFKTEDCWGALYRKGHYIKTHHHWPSALSWTYYVKTSENTEPFIFVGNGVEKKIYPRVGDLIIFPSVMNHRVPVSQTDDERIVVVGNIR